MGNDAIKYFQSGFEVKMAKNGQIWTKIMVIESFTVLNTRNCILMCPIWYSDTILDSLYSFQWKSKIIGVGEPPEPPKWVSIGPKH